jgi:hypothetical protein
LALPSSLSGSSQGSASLAPFTATPSAPHTIHTEAQVNIYVAQDVRSYQRFHSHVQAQQHT